MARWEWVLGAALAVAVIGNAIAYLAVIRPLADVQRGHQQRLLAMQRQIRNLQAQGKALEAEIRTLQDVEAYRAQFPEHGRLVGVGGELSHLAETLSVKMPGITYQPEQLKEVDLVRVRLTLAVEGGYGQVRRFLHELEKRRRYLVVERMALVEQRSTAARGNQVAMQLSLAGYFR